MRKFFSRFFCPCFKGVRVRPSGSDSTRTIAPPNESKRLIISPQKSTTYVSHSNISIYIAGEDGRQPITPLKVQIPTKRRPEVRTFKNRLTTLVYYKSRTTATDRSRTQLFTGGEEKIKYRRKSAL